MDNADVLITGADGYLGLRLARMYLQQTAANLILWVRAADAGEFQSKRDRLTDALGPFAARVGFQSGDLVAAQPFATIDPASVRIIVHAASVTRFNVDAETAHQVNIAGTRKVLAFAGRCHHLEGLALRSTVYASGLKSGVIEEIPCDGRDGFANHYERSKWAAEQILLQEFDHLPWRIFRMATVIADAMDGRVTQYNAFHNTLKLFYHGLLSLVPGLPDTPVYVVTGDFVTAAIYELMAHAGLRTIYHVAHPRRAALSLGDLIDLAFEVFEGEAAFRSRRVLKPLYADAASFDLLADGLHAVGGDIVNQAVSSVAPFGKQLFVHKEICQANLVSALRTYREPDVRRLVQQTCAYLVRTGWGKMKLAERTGDVR